MAITQIIKDQTSTVDYMFDWSAWLTGPDGNGTDTIASVAWTLSPQIAEGSTSHTTTSATVWLAGLQDSGTAGTPYSVKCQVTTAAGRIEDVTVPVIFI
jgi:adenylylsulfate kinase-like enzyme